MFYFSIISIYSDIIPTSSKEKENDELLCLSLWSANQFLAQKVNPRYRDLFSLFMINNQSRGDGIFIIYDR